VTEFVLPGMHGVALVNELRTTFPNLPAVILTTGAMAFPPNFQRRKIWILRKPCTPDELWTTLLEASHPCRGLT
jgi:CheY-like chemotaxis protein